MEEPKMRDYPTLTKLRAGETVEVEGIPVQMVDGDVELGDTYVAERNTGPHLLTAKVINKKDRWIVPEEPAYFYDIPECVRVEARL